MDSTSMTPADFSALMGNGNGFGGNNAWWIILLFLFIGGNGWNRNGDFGQYATAASQQEILFGQRFSNLDNKMDRLGNGLADVAFSLNNTITGEGRSTQAQIAALNANLDQSTCKIINAIRDDGDKTRAIIQTNEIQTLRDKIGALEADARMCGVVKYPLNMTYTAGGSPFCNYPGNGCGCGNI